MCAIFGFINRRNRAPKLETLSSIVRANIARGPHSFGMSWIDTKGRLHCFKQCGRLTDHLGILAMVRGAVAVVGHLRWATHGAPSDNINNHPHPCDGGWLVHNGVIGNYAELVRSRRLWPVSECDSEALGLLVEKSEGSLLRRCVDAVEQTEGRLAMMALWSRPQALIVARRGNPLHVARSAEGWYFGTLAEGLPGIPASVSDNSARVFTVRAGRWIERTLNLTRPVAREAPLFDECNTTYAGG